MVFSLLQKRRSIRKFKQIPVENDKIEILKEALLRSPSSRSLNPWEFIIVTDKDLLYKLSEAKPHGSLFLKNAPLGIVVCSDPRKSDVWIEDCSIASIVVQLAAESLKLGSCWIQIRERMYSNSESSESYIQKILHIPSYIKIESIIAIGYPAEKKEAHSKETLDYKKIFNNLYNINY
jgi:nitroreductase